MGKSKYAIKQNPDYILTNGFYFGPGISKKTKQGKAFGYFLRHQNKKLSLDKIAKETQWKDVEKEMSKLITIVNLWSGYKIRETRNGEKIDYLMKKEGIKYPYNPEDKIVTYSL